MAWDPTDYKDMLDDDWNDQRQRVYSMLDEMFFGGVYIEEMLKNTAKILGNNKVLQDTEFESMVSSQEYDTDELADYLMDHYYLTPIGRKKARLKNENKNEDMRARTLNENDFELWSDDDDEDNLEDTEEYDMGEVSSQLEEIFQDAANKGMPFEVIRDLVDQALDQVDWVEAG